MDPDTDVLVKWTRTGEINCVRIGDLICPEGPLRVSSLVIMVCNGEEWEGTVTAVEDETWEDTSSSSDDIPLAQLKRADLSMDEIDVDDIPLAEVKRKSLDVQRLVAEKEELRQMLPCNISLCSHYLCMEGIFAACTHCLSLLCFKHFKDDMCENHVEKLSISADWILDHCTPSVLDDFNSEWQQSHNITTPEAQSPEEHSPEVQSPEAQSPEAHSPEVQCPEEQSPEAHSPEVQSPGEESPEEQSPEVQSPEEQSPEEQSPEAQSPEAHSPEERSPEEQSPEEQSPEAQSPEEQSPEEQSPEAQSPEAHSPEAQSPEAHSPEEQAHEEEIHDIQTLQDSGPEQGSKVQKPKTRKRSGDPQQWKKNLRKRCKNAGKPYTSTTGKRCPAKVMHPPCTSSCWLKCSEKINNEMREQIFLDYWSAGDAVRQRDFIRRNVALKSSGKTTKRPSSRQRQRKAFTLPLQNSRTPVCRKFFLSTLGIGEKLLRYTVENNQGDFIQVDKRGKHTPHNKTSVTEIHRIRSHIESFPSVESHYCRKESGRKYLSGDLNIATMYRLYTEKCAEDNAKPKSLALYRKVFCEEYNLSFHKPKKDQCNKCTAFHHLPNDQKEEAAEEYKVHMERKERARQEKKADKERSEREACFQTFTFDLQQTLPTPSSNASLFYYKRKLSSYNLTVYEQNTKAGTCYLWTETEGKRGSCEIGTCLMKTLLSLPETTTHVSLFSDCCGGQNRNKFIAACLNYVVRTSHIKVIEQKFLESGHTHMEVDSIHSAIEASKKKVDIFHPNDWVNVIKLARRSNPYEVVQLVHEDFVDLRDLEEKLFRNTKKDVEGEKVKWLEIRVIRYDAQSPNTILFKYNYNEEFRRLKVRMTSRGCNSVDSMKLSKLYKEQLPVSTEKKQDLVSLCVRNVVPDVFHSFYKNLASHDEVERLPEPDVLESEE